VEKGSGEDLEGQVTLVLERHLAPDGHVRAARHAVYFHLRQHTCAIWHSPYLRT